mmetsp:Transcript_67176/g.200661  ORF Transcript_67176/g.200661 Transcript_67176/m.200661 type:complete len:288 (+) Transcript_67176:534-1397(+)
MRPAEDRPDVADDAGRRPVRVRDGAPLRGLHLRGFALAALARRLRGEAARHVQPAQLEDAQQGPHRVLVHLPAGRHGQQGAQRGAPRWRAAVPRRLPARGHAAPRPLAQLAGERGRGAAARHQANPGQPHGAALWAQGGHLLLDHGLGIAPLLRRHGVLHAGGAVLPDDAARLAAHHAGRRRRPVRGHDDAAEQIPLGAARRVPARPRRQPAPLLPPGGGAVGRAGGAPGVAQRVARAARHLRRHHHAPLRRPPARRVCKERRAVHRPGDAGADWRRVWAQLRRLTL